MSFWDTTNHKEIWIGVFCWGVFDFGDKTEINEPQHTSESVCFIALANPTTELFVYRTRPSFTMATPAGQAKAQALNTKLEGEARIAIDAIDRQFLRKEGRRFHSCAVKCYDTRGTTSEALEACVQNCELPHRKANAIVQQVS